uniref:Uncharacterized protein n=1 Tax=Eumeta variegata TaxID=151549 RepID=A0A4C1ZCW8_EUMVA|nr:hypothetical protein EVAR_62755_1 [Eumeta japonica]
MRTLFRISLKVMGLRSSARIEVGGQVCRKLTYTSRMLRYDPYIEDPTNRYPWDTNPNQESAQKIIYEKLRDSLHRIKNHSGRRLSVSASGHGRAA